MRRPADHRWRIAAALAALVMTGCPAEPLPDGPGPQDVFEGDLGPDGPIGDMRPWDAATPPDLDLDLDLDLDPGDAPPPDALPFDLPDPGIAPARADSAVLVGRTDTWIGWIIGDRLYGARIDTAQPDAGGMPPVERPRPLAELPDIAGPITGVRAPNGRPWVLVPDGDDGMLRAHDLSAGLDPRPLGLWPPVRTAIAGESILLVARAGPTPDAPVATVRLLDDGPRAPIVDTRGIELPTSIAAGPVGWVFAFDDGICQFHLPDGDPGADPHPGQPWRCGARAGAEIFGDARRIFAVGPIDDDLRAWTLMPGATLSTRPDADFDDPRAFTLAVDADVETLHPIPGGRALAVTGPAGVEIHLITADEINIVPAPDDGTLLGVSRAFDSRFFVLWDPALGRPVVRPAEARAGPAPPTDGLGCRPLPEQCDAYDGYIDLDCVEGRENARCCRERALADAESTALNLSSDEAGVEDVPTLPWFVTHTPAGLVMIAAYPDRLDLLRFAYASTHDNEDPDVRIARFEGIERVERYGRHLSRLVIHGVRSTPPPVDDPPDAGPPDAGPPDADLDAAPLDADPDEALDADPPLDADPDAAPEPPGPGDVLLWYLGRQLLPDGTPRAFTYETRLPCAPILHLTMGDGYARIYCPDFALDVPVDVEGPRLADAIETPYPIDDVRWIGPPITSGGAQRFLAAAGDTHALHIWTDAGDGAAIIDDALPPALAAIRHPDRTHPIRLPEDDSVQPARIVDDRIQIHIPGLGWRAAPASRWPQSASFSTTEPLAITLAQITDPDAPGYSRINRRYTIMLHDLSVEALHWGQPVTMSLDPLETDAELVGRFVFGARFADHDAGRPLVWYGYGDPRNITLLARGALCNPARLGQP